MFEKLFVCIMKKAGWFESIFTIDSWNQNDVDLLQIEKINCSTNCLIVSKWNRIYCSIKRHFSVHRVNHQIHRSRIYFDQNTKIDTNEIEMNDSRKNTDTQTHQQNHSETKNFHLFIARIERYGGENNSWPSKSKTKYHENDAQSRFDKWKRHCRKKKTIQKKNQIRSMLKWFFLNQGNQEWLIFEKTKSRVFEL